MSNLPLKKDQAHLLNPYRPPSAPNGFKISRWKPIYDQIVGGHIMGRSNKELAEQFDYTTVTIGNILRSDQAQILIKQAHDRIRAEILEDTSEKVSIQVQIKEKALARVKDFLHNDEAARNSPFAYINTIKSLTGLSAPSTNPIPQVSVQVQNNTQINNTIKPEQFDRMTRALEISSGIVDE